ncbi:MAG: HlyD family efflux transporter periplasmic adaptor subunit [Myxococcales bacterium]|nr:HlyD family efflux transporter periplasmic adaptor subunit [Myxococcales bacterium]
MIALVALALLLASTAAAIGQLRAIPPTFARAGLWIGEVERGEMVREVQGNGTLIPERVQWVTALSAVRIEKIFVRPGATVEADTLLLQLGNPDLEIQTLEAERQVAAARTVLATMRVTLTSEVLGLEIALALLRGDEAKARRKADRDTTLSERGYLASDDAHAARAELTTLDARLKLERRRLATLRGGVKERLAAQAAELARLETIAAARREQLAALQVRAGVDGVVQELPLEPGQWVNPGALLAKIAQPDRLKAQLAIPETQIKDVVVGLPAKIDTRDGLVDGEVTRIAPAASKGAVTVDVRLHGPLPRGARPDLNIAGTVELERIPDVLYVRKPAFVQPDSMMAVLREDDDGAHATRTNVQFGRVSASTVEVIAGLREGDRIILSDLSKTADDADRIALE